MKCNQIKEKFSDFLTGELDKNIREKIQEHITVCSSCREELENLSAIWTKLEVLPEEQPSDKVRTRFYAVLDQYKQNQDRKTVRPRKERFSIGWSRHWIPARPAFQFSIAALLLVVGLAGGYFLRSGWQRKGEIAQLRQEVHQLSRITAVSLLQQESLSEQMGGIRWSSRLSQENRASLADFLRTLNLDISAISPSRNNSIAQSEFMQSLSEQASPVVEIALTFVKHF
jgi:anti-sigma factor RsiW